MKQVISIRLNPDEAMKLEKMMKQTGLNQTQLIKMALYSDKKIEIVEQRKEVYQLLQSIRVQLDTMASNNHKLDEIRKEMWELCQQLYV